MLRADLPRRGYWPAVLFAASLAAGVGGVAAARTSSAQAPVTTVAPTSRAVALTTRRPRRPGFSARLIHEVHVDGELHARGAGLGTVDLPSARMRVRFVAEYTVIEVDAEGRPTRELYRVEESEWVQDDRPRTLLRAGTVLEVDRTAPMGRRLVVGGRPIPRARARTMEFMLLPDLEDHAVDRASEPSAAVSPGSRWSIPVDEIAAVVSFQAGETVSPSLFEASATLLGPATVLEVPGLELRQDVLIRDFAPALRELRHADRSGSVDRMERRVFFPDDPSLPPLRSEALYRHAVVLRFDVDGTSIRVDGELTTSIRDSLLLP